MKRKHGLQLHIWGAPVVVLFLPRASPQMECGEDHKGPAARDRVASGVDGRERRLS